MITVKEYQVEELMPLSQKLNDTRKVMEKVSKWDVYIDDVFVWTFGNRVSLNLYLQSMED